MKQMTTGRRLTHDFEVGAALGVAQVVRKLNDVFAGCLFLDVFDGECVFARLGVATAHEFLALFGDFHVTDVPARPVRCFH